MSTNNSFNPREHLMTIKNRQSAVDYLPVQWRLVWFREQCSQGTIFTELVHMDLDKEVESEVMQWDSETKRMKSVTRHGYGVAVFKATITDGHGGSSTGYGSEKASDFGDFLEKAETKAIGRALAALGFGTQFAPELNEEHRIVDSPVDFQPAANGNGSNGSSNGRANGNSHTSHTQVAAAVNEANAPISERQVGSIRKLSEVLGKSEPENLTSLSFLNAKQLIQQLTAEYRQQHSKAS
jgi:hypothetical protein